LGNRLDIDNNGSVDALTDGLIILRYLFGLTGDTLIKGVVATDAERVSAADIELHMATLTSLDLSPRYSHLPLVLLLQRIRRQLARLKLLMLIAQ